MPPTETLTIVLTLKDRAAFTYRWMRYMDHCRCPYPILIADGGADQAIEARLRQPEHYPSLRYTYLRYPFDRDYGTYYRKLADVVGRVTTPFVLMADNDDFFLLEAIPSLVAFLRDHSDFASCGGRQVNLELQTADGIVVNAPSAIRYRATVAPHLKPITDDRAVDRLCAFLALRPWSAWYHVHRTAAFQAATGAIEAHDFRDPTALEIHVLFSLLMTGKAMQLDALSYVRQSGSSQLCSTLLEVGNLAERFLASNAFADLHRSVESFVTLQPDERFRVYRALAEWLAVETIKEYEHVRVAYTPPPPTDRLEWAYRRARRLAQPIAAILRGRPAVATARLAGLEPFILDPDSSLVAPPSSGRPPS